MKSLNLANVDILNLQAEVSDVIEKTKSFTTKFHLNNLFSQFEPKIKNFNDLKNEMIKKYGKENKEGNFYVQQFVDDSIEEKIHTNEYDQFLKEFNELLAAEVEIEYSPLKLSIFDTVESDKFYKILFKFIKE